MKKSKLAFYHNKFLLSWMITLLILSIVFLASVEHFPLVHVPNFTGILIKQADLGIRNIFLSRFSTNKVPNDNIAVVAIDNKTLSDTTGLGRFQDFKRSYYAKVIDNLKRDGAIVIGIDVLFSEKSEEDTTLIDAVQKAGNVVLGFSLADQLFPIDALANHALSMGYFHPKVNENNATVYSITPMRTVHKESYEAFSFAIMRKYLDTIHGKTTMPGPDSIGYASGLKSYLVSDQSVPFASDGADDVFVNFLPASSRFHTLSFVDVYHGTYDPELVRDKIILIGSTASALYDKFNTPLGIQDGVLVHANMLNTILNKSFIVEVDQATEIWLLVFLAFLLTLFTLHVDNRVYQLSFSFIGLVIFLFGEISYFVYFHKLFQYPIELFLIVILVALIVTGYKYLYEEKGKRLLRNTLSQYLAEDLVLNVLNNYEEVKLGGSRKTITTFFSDIAGFTSISENMEPEELVQFLSIYLKEVSDIIMHEKGFINKYEGDAVMAIWGAFGEEKNQALLACRSALAQQKKINELNAQFKKDHGFDIQVRMGINKGIAVVGNIGSQGKKIEYTALGDSVNTASRFEGINKVYSTLICVGESVMEDTKDVFVFRKLDNIQVKGKEKPVLIYELIGARDEVSAEKINVIRRFEEGLALYFERRFQEAFELFSGLWEAHADGPSYVFMQRAEALKDQEIDTNWSGAFRATEK